MYLLSICVAASSHILQPKKLLLNDFNPFLLISVLISDLFEVPLELESPTQISLVDEASGEVSGFNFSDMSIMLYRNQNCPVCLLFCCIFIIISF